MSTQEMFSEYNGVSVYQYAGRRVPAPPNGRITLDWLFKNNLPVYVKNVAQVKLGNHTHKPMIAITLSDASCFSIPDVDVAIKLDDFVSTAELRKCSDLSRAVVRGDLQLVMPHVGDAIPDEVRRLVHKRTTRASDTGRNSAQKLAENSGFLKTDREEPLTDAEAANPRTLRLLHLAKTDFDAFCEDLLLGGRLGSRDESYFLRTAEDKAANKYREVHG